KTIPVRCLFEVAGNRFCKRRDNDTGTSNLDACGGARCGSRSLPVRSELLVETRRLTWSGPHCSRRRVRIFPPQSRKKQSEILTLLPYVPSATPLALGTHPKL